MKAEIKTVIFQCNSTVNPVTRDPLGGDQPAMGDHLPVVVLFDIVKYTSNISTTVHHIVSMMEL